MGFKTLLCDMSPVLYSNLFSATNEALRIGSKTHIDAEGVQKVDYDYEDIVLFKIIEEISKLKVQFGVDEVVLAFDNSKGGYWRKDYWSGYKFKRKQARNESNIRWDLAFETFDVLKEQLAENTSFKCVNIERVEGDDIIFVLSKYLSDKGQEVIIHSLDHDLIYNLKHPGVSYFRTRKSQKLPGKYVDITPGEILDLEIDHLIGGDPGDYIKNVKAYSRFSDKFNELYDKTEENVWKKRHEIDCLFTEKYGTSAYNHPRYGFKMFSRSNLTVEELLAQNKIYSWNYELNKKIAMPEGIPIEIRTDIIEKYNSANADRNLAKFQKYLTENKLFELIGSAGML